MQILAHTMQNLFAGMLFTLPYVILLCLFVFHVNASPQPITFGLASSLSYGWNPEPRYAAGIHAAFKEARDTGGARAVFGPFLRFTDGGVNATMTSNLEDLFNDSTVDFVLATPGTVAARQSEGMFISNNNVMIAPMTGYVPIHTDFHPHIINVRAGYTDEAIAQLNELVGRRHKSRFVLIYSSTVVPLAAYVDSLEKSRLKFLDIYTVFDLRESDPVALVQKALRDKAEAIILAVLLSSATSVIDAIANETARNQSYTVPIIATASYGADEYLNYIRVKQYNNIELYQTQVVPHPEGGSKVAASFRRAMAAYEGAATQFDFVAMEGYIVGRFVSEILRHIPGTVFSRQIIKDTIYSTRMFRVDDVLLGPYSDNCDFPTPSDGRSSMCNCTQGMRLVDTVYLEKPSHRFVPLTSSSYSSTECYATSSTVHRPLILSVSDANLTHPLQLGLRSVHGTVAEVVPFTQGMATDFVMASIDTPSSALSSTHVDGAVVEAADEGTTLPSFAGLATVNTPSTDTRTLYLLPTAQHELHEAANTLLADTATPPSTIRMVAVTHSGEDWSTLVADMRRSVVSVGVSLSAARPITVVEAVTARDAQGVGRALLGISPHVPHVVVGLASTSELRAVLTAAATAATLMSTASTSSSLPRVVLLFNEAARLWSEVETCASDASCRLL
eukprot:PhM_4_TR9132/c0_g2_i7/m.34676